MSIMSYLKKVVLSSVFLSVVATLSGCFLNPADSGGGGNEDPTLIVMISRFSELTPGTPRELDGYAKANFSIAPSAFSYAVTDTDGGDVSKYFTVTAGSFSAKQEVDFGGDLGLTLLASDTTPSGDYTFSVTVSGNGISKSGSRTFSVENANLGGDVFVYYENSTFTYVIKSGVSTTRTAKMQWTVTGYNASTGVATISNTVDPATTEIPAPATFYFRKATTGGLDYSTNGTSWVTLTAKDGSKVHFLFGVEAADPSSLLGSAESGVRAKMVSYPGGSSQGWEVYSEYNASGRDAYLYTDYSKERYSRDVGFVYAVTFTSDHSDYPAFTYKREVDLVSYKIYLSDGTVREGGEQKPAAPTNLKATYVHRKSSYNSSTGMYEKRSYMSLSWTDNSNNEIGFNIYMKATDGEWYPIDNMVMYEDGPSFTPTTFAAGKYSGSIKAGYYVDWSSGQYTFRITAFTLTDESDPSNEVVATVY